MTEIEKRLGKLAEEINQEHQAFRRAFKATFRSALRAGDLLNEAKAQAGHGNWTAWVEENCEFSDRTARDYMRLANNRDKVEEMLGKTAESADLSIKEVLRELSAPKEDVRTDSIPITQVRAEGPLRWAGVELREEPTEPREQPKEERSEDKDDYDYAQSLMAKVNEGDDEIAEVIRVVDPIFLVRRADGNPIRVVRKRLLEAGWKKCSCCDGYGISR